jgi:lipoprotein-anchoring transpeptidase ErfK/SrfK
MRLIVLTIGLCCSAGLLWYSARPSEASAPKSSDPVPANHAAVPGLGIETGGATQPDRQPEDPLETLFAAADQSADALAPLISSASRRIASASADNADVLGARLEPYCKRAFFGPERFQNMQELGLSVHKVQKGEVPGEIAKRYGFSDGLLSRLNEGYAPNRLRIGQELKVLDLRKIELKLAVDRARHRLAAWRIWPNGDRVLVMYVTVGLGAPETPTPTGATKVVERALDCEWTDPNSGVTYPPGDPGNLLGGYWMRLDDAGIGRKGIGLHGFTGDDPSAWLGKDASNGCVRMLQDDIDRVFHLALVGTPVEFAP